MHDWIILGAIAALSVAVLWWCGRELEGMKERASLKRQHKEERRTQELREERRDSLRRNALSRARDEIVHFESDDYILTNRAAYLMWDGATYIVRSAAGDQRHEQPSRLAYDKVRSIRIQRIEHVLPKHQLPPGESELEMRVETGDINIPFVTFPLPSWRGRKFCQELVARVRTIHPTFAPD